MAWFSSVTEQGREEPLSIVCIGRAKIVIPTVGSVGSVRLAPPTPDGPGLVYQYNKLGQMRFATVGSGASAYTVEIRYDLAGRKVRMSDSGMGIWVYDYDGAGNLACQKEAKNQPILFGYDRLNRLVGKDYLSSAACTPLSTEAVGLSGYDAQCYYDGQSFTFHSSERPQDKRILFGTT